MSIIGDVLFSEHIDIATERTLDRNIFVNQKV